MALDDILDEHEQSERVQDWLRRNGAGLVGGVLLGLAAIGGWQWWERDQDARQSAAADRYQAVVNGIEAGEAAAAGQVAALEPGTFQVLAALQLAAAQVEAGESEAAVTTLRGIRSDNPALQDVVARRLARLLIDAGEPTQALELLGTADSPAALEIRGDAQLALGKAELAREAYTQALAGMDVASPQRGILELKLTDAGGSVDRTEAQS
ncbi:YfgM family protein [Lysobacter sp. A3-1-A15]|uniref:YfgM family protein n=1 Tax=Novilysobacter viscosus TaxID=3098602 RepID=UPI002ED9DF12